MFAITETWVKDRVGLPDDQLYNVRSLMLPGARAEKITHIGGALQNFVRLQSLDLSNNEIVSLEGLEHLQLLETLNLYLNQISSRTELFRLRHNQNLRDLDVRLNPISTRDPKCRLYSIHLLPHLCRLDALEVTAGERSVALEYFATDQAVEFSEPHQSTLRAISSIDSTRAPVVVQETTQKVTGLADMSIGLLDELLREKGLCDDSMYLQGRPTAVNPVYTAHSKERMAWEHAGGGSIPGSEVKYRRVELQATLAPEPPKESPSLGSKEAQWVADATATLRPVIERMHQPGQPLSYDIQAKVGDVLIETLLRPVQRQASQILHNSQAELTATRRRLEEREAELDDLKKEKQLFMARVQDLIGAPVNGVSALVTDSLTSTTVPVLRDLEDCLCSLRRDTAAGSTTRMGLQTEVSSFRNLLQEKTCDLEKLTKAKKTLETRVRFIINSPSNVAIQSEDPRSGLVLPSTSVVQELEVCVTDLRNECKELTAQLEVSRAARDTLAIKASEAAAIPQLRELTTMLQESHRSLAATNEHVLKQLEDERYKHTKELEQLRWNYDELKRTAELL